MCLRRVIFFVWLACVSGVTAGDEPPNELIAAANHISSAGLDSASAFTIFNSTILQRDLKILLDTGTFIFFKPVQVDSTTIRYGGLFVGRGRFQYAPPLAMERQQLQRFLKSDSLNRSFRTMLLLFDSTTAREMAVDTSHKAAVPEKASAAAATYLKYLGESKDRYFSYTTLRNVLGDGTAPYLLAMADVDKCGTLTYMNNPFEREQVGLFRREMQVIYRHVFQPICQYAIEADAEQVDYNGIDRPALQVRHYDISGRIERSGKMHATAAVDLTWEKDACRIVAFFLDPEMEVDSVTAADGHRVPFARYKDSEKHFGLWLILDETPKAGDKATFTFYYKGDVAERELGFYYVFAGATWYPRYGGWQRSTFDIRLKSPHDYTLIATGNLVDSSRVKDTLFTHWRETKPALYASFNLGLFKRYRFGRTDENPLDIYFSDHLHRSGGHKVSNVSSDIEQSLKYYTKLFGQLPYDTIVVSEVLDVGSISFPGFVLLGTYTWADSDIWGFERLHRSHETAHQWFGAGVGVDSYRDVWLSEGFAEYCSYMYLESVAGTKLFLDRLNLHRKEIMSERKNAGAIGLGIRAGNLRDQDFYSLIIYARGAFVLHMLRYLLMDLQTGNEDRFHALMRDFYQKYLDRQASTRDFMKMAERYADMDLTWFFNQWVFGNHIPTYKLKYSVRPSQGGGYIANLRISQKNVPPDFKMYVPVEIESMDGQKTYERCLVDKPEVEVDLKVASRVKKIRLNPFYAVLAEVD